MGDEKKPSYSDIEYEDAESFRGSHDKISIKQISLERFHNAMREGSKEWTESGIVTRLIDGKPVDILMPNQREIFNNSVEMCYYPLCPYINSCRDENVKKMFETVNLQRKMITDWFNEELKKLDEENEERINTPDNSRRQEWIQEYNKRLRLLEGRHQNKLVSLHKELLKSLSFLLHEMNYFEEEMMIG